MHIAVPAETSPGELRVAITPDSVARLVKAGHVVRVQSGAGQRAGFPDATVVHLATDDSGRPVAIAEGVVSIKDFRRS